MSKDLRPLTQPQEQPQYPFMQINFTRGGILLSIFSNAFSKQDILIPLENSNAMAMGWLAQADKTVFLQALKMRQETQAQKETIASALKNPHVLEGV